MRVGISLRGPVFGLALLVSGAAGFGGSAEANIVRNLGTLGVGSNVLTTCTLTACTGSGEVLPVLDGFTHQIHFDVASDVTAASVNQLISGLTVTAVNLYVRTDGISTEGAANSTTGVANLIATGVQSGSVGQFWDLAAVVGAGNYFVEIIGTTTASDAAYDNRVSVSPVPLPPALILLMTALFGLVGVARIRRSRAAA